MDVRILQTKKPISRILLEMDRIFTDLETDIHPVSVEQVDALDKDELRVYCHYRGIYTIVTNELCTYLTELIGPDSVIEIGSGNGTLALGMKIQGTDSYMQQRPEIIMSYMATGQHPIRYGRFIEKIDGIEALKKYTPKVALGSWITHKWREDEPRLEGNQWAPDEEEIMANCERFIMVGNKYIHRNNRLLASKKYKVKIHQPDCIRSRAAKPELDCIFEFTKK